MTHIIVITLGVVLSGLLTIYLLNYFINVKIRKKISEIEFPLALGILKSGIFICGGLMTSEIITSFQTLTKVLPSIYEGDNLLVQEISYFCIYLGIVLFAILITIWLGLIMFSIISKGKNVFIEAANNNFYSVLVFSAILLTLTISVKSGITPLLDHLIPYPTLPIYR